MQPPRSPPHAAVVLRPVAGPATAARDRRSRRAAEVIAASVRNPRWVPRHAAGTVFSVPPPIRLRLAIEDDAEAIARIYNREVLEATSTFDLVPRSIEEQRQWLRERTGAFSAIVAVDTTTDEVVGFAALSPYKPRPAYNTTVEDSVYVDQNRSGEGIGRLLLEHLVQLARASGFHAVIARIEAGGEASRALHAKCGFELVGIERQVGRKFKRWLDVAVMQLLLD